MKKVEPKIVEFMLKNISPAEYNPRIITDEAMDGLTKSLERFI